MYPNVVYRSPTLLQAIAHQILELCVTVKFYARSNSELIFLATRFDKFERVRCQNNVSIEQSFLVR